MPYAQLPVTKNYFKTSASFCSNAGPLSSCAITFPVGSIKTLKGIPSILYVETAALCHCLRSLICAHARLSFFIACTHESLSWSLLYAATTFGFSFLQGPHQLAQKSINTYLPLKSLMLTGFPFISFIVRLGACLSTHEAPSFVLLDDLACAMAVFIASRPLCPLNLPAACVASESSP